MPFAAYNSSGVRLLCGALADSLEYVRKATGRELSEAEVSDIRKSLVHRLDDGSRFRRARSRCAEARRSSRGFRVARRELSGYPRPARGEYTNSAKNRRNELYLICCRGLRDLLGDSGRARYSFSTRRTTRRRRAGRDTPSIANSPARFGGSLIVSSIGSFCR